MFKIEDVRQVLGQEDLGRAHVYAGRPREEPRAAILLQVLGDWLYSDGDVSLVTAIGSGGNNIPPNTIEIQQSSRVWRLSLT